MKRSLLQNGAIVGALLGGLSRLLLIVLNLHGYVGSAFALMYLCVPAVALGLLCGGLAGNSRTPLRGALWGGFLSGASFAAMVVPLALFVTLLGGNGGARDVETLSLPYLIQRTVLGAIVGAIGAYIGSRGRPPLPDSPR